MTPKRISRSPRTSWDPVADWYAGWVGPHGSDHHRYLAIPAILDALAPRPGERVLDIGCGPGVLAAPLAAAGAHYTGVDASPRLIEVARRRQAGSGRFVVGDATRLAELPELQRHSFHAAVFLLSIQDMDPLDRALASAAWALGQGGRVVILLTHPCFRVPRQSGWGWDGQRRLRYRRVDRYLTPLAVPMKAYERGAGATRSFHRPLEQYVNGLYEQGLLVELLREIPTYRLSGDRAERQSDQEIPLFLVLRARLL
jgi:SAM-dependent methyltransferase